MKKITDSRFYKHFICALTFFIMTGSIYGMKRVQEEPTGSAYPFTEEKPPRFEKWQNIWIKTADNQIIAMPEWQVDQIKVLQMLLVNQKGTNRKNNPINISELKKHNGAIVNTSTNTLNMIKTTLELSKNPEGLSLFLRSTAQEKKEDYTTLINTAFDLEANALSAALASAILLPEIQQNISAHLLSPIMTYFITRLEFRPQYKLQGQPLRPIETHIKISPDGKYILVTGRENTIFHDIHLWGLDTKKFYKYFSGDINNLEFSSIGKYIIRYRANMDDNEHNLDITNIFKGSTRTHHNSSCIAFSLNDNYYLYNNLNEPGEIKLISTETMTELSSLHEHKAQVNTIKFSPNGNYIVSGSNDNSPNNLILWDGNTFQKIANLTHKGAPTGHVYPVIQADFTPDSKYIISQDTQDNVIIWDVASKKPILKFDNHAGILWDMAHEQTLLSKNTKFSYNPKMLHSYIQSDYNNRKMLYELTVNAFFNHPILPINPKAMPVLLTKPNIIIGQQHSLITPFELQQEVNIAPNNNYNVEYAVESSDSEYLLFSYIPNTITLRCSDTGNLLNIPIQPFTSIHFSPNNDYIIATYPHTNNAVFSMWNIADLKMMREIYNASLTLSHAQFLYRLYIAQINKTKVLIDKNDPDYEVYKSLPANIKNLVDRFLPFGLTSDIAQKALQRFRK